MHHDLAILGAGFSGSLCALIAKQIGMNSILIEKGSHPRFAIGESSTPQADIALANIAEKYNLRNIKPFSSYGTWKETYPDISCGPKRGFTYINHCGGGELLVAANPDQYHADTHWYREEFDAFLVDEVKQSGISYIDQTEFEITAGKPWSLTSKHHSITSDFIIDATGGANPLSIAQVHPFQTNTRCIFSHFTGVTPWGKLHSKPEHPFTCHESALHHIFDGGWMYVLHFDNGITSAGFVLETLARPNDSWNSLIHEFPDIKQQFKHAKSVMPIVETKRMQRCASNMVGSNWAMLPHAAYFVDPMHSSGNAHTLQCIDRLMQCLLSNELFESLQQYESKMYCEAMLVDQLVHGAYESMEDFESFTNYVMLYFAGADFSERKRRDNVETGFLNSHDEAYKAKVAYWYGQAVAGNPIPNLASEIEPWNLAGLCDPMKKNMYDYA